MCIAVGPGVRELRALTGRMLCTLDLRGADGVLWVTEKELRGMLWIPRLG